ncbi:hypothetical protein CDL12_16299 [Handroanthus impetiginosus]|uniref:ACB domain-containing protein n=1 Tax=Handroanthus impetiginosus TaxID=429701 RepID=A0A2G9G5I5_9LAMI|nr:hypothetical protein CDL12_26925 [Handroanthus impetiginosus]PIN11104.1 hypothetical protein CDL12_16299 [Handroanthus impetiginosus]
MDAVEIFLLYVVGFSVLVFLILDSLKSEQSSDFGDSDSKTGIGSCALESVKENDNQEEEKSVGAKEQTVCEHEIEGEEGFLDDWEGIERTELEKNFGEAVVFVSSKSNADQIRDVKLELYGLQKVALEGPCHHSQPMPLKVSARAKWNAWHKLGNMSREEAMEKYIDVLSRAIPGWKGEGTLSAQAAATYEDLTSTPQNLYGVEAAR